MQLELPGHFRTLPWTTLQEPSGATASALYRSRMTCNQIAARYASDSEHNGLIQKVVEDSQGDKFWERVQGSRQELKRDHRRICAWTKVTDRDERVRYVGMNFRGQAVVEAAVSEGETQGGPDEWARTEKIFNADGMLIERRNPAPRGRAWRPSDGYMTRSYDEVNPSANGGADDWIPQWWTKRFNLKEERNYPRSGVEPTRATWWEGGAGADLKQKSIAWTGTSYDYEPVFNQVFRIEDTVKFSGGSDKTSRALVIDYDYQEMKGDSFELFEALYSRWSWHWRVPEQARVTVDQATGQSNGTAASAAWLSQAQVPMRFYSGDINGDGVGGTGPDASEAKMRGFPVRMTWFERDGTNAAKVRRLTPAPHGRPARIDFEDGRLLDIRYTSRDPANAGFIVRRVRRLGR